MSFEKYTKDGRVAVIVSPGYGAGWSSWGEPQQREQLLFDKRFVTLKLENQPDIIERERVRALLEEVFPGNAPYEGGFAKAHVEWIEPGTIFRISEYDGNEDLIVLDNDERFTA